MRARRCKAGSSKTSVKSEVEDTATEDTLLGREEEVASIVSKVEDCVNRNASTSLYLSGPPGTGKTAAVNRALRLLDNPRLTVVKLNCVSVNTEPAFLRALCEQLGIQRTNNARSCVQLWLANTTRNVLVLVLDELDYIQTKHRAVLYTAFKWPSLYSSLVVIAISNSFDLTERELPKLKLDNPPELMPFAPYSTTALTAILTHKLSNSNAMDRQAVELCARKVAAMTGDVRQALNIANNMLPMISSSLRTKQDMVLTAITNVYRSPLDKVNIPLHQKILLATILRLVNKHNNTTIDKDELFQVLDSVCDAVSVCLSDVGGAQEALSLLESQSLIKTTPRSCQLLVDPPTIINFIADSVLLANINSIHI